MINSENFLLSFLIGIAVGVFFFWGLWWTICRCSYRPNLLLFWGSFLVRSAIACAIFYLVGGRDFLTYLFLISGFIASKTAIVRMKTKESRHEDYS